MAWRNARWLGLGLVFALAGCAKQAAVKPEATPTPVAQNNSNHLQEASQPAAHYVVKKGDCLWRIASKHGVLGDPLRWPLLYRENRDQIEDPDIITPLENLAYHKQYSEAEIADAVRKAKETPKYVPHSMPRQSLPVQY